LPRKAREQQSKAFSTEKEKGETFYEAELVVNGHSKDVLIDVSGAVVEVEEEMALDSLSADVKAGLQAKAGKGKILKVESLTKKGKTGGVRSKSGHQREKV